MIVVAGEISSNAVVDIDQIVKDAIIKIGYIKSEYGLDVNSVKIIKSINKQSGDIAQGVDTNIKKEQGAGDQGLMFGYACDQTPTFMPLPIYIAHELTKKLAELRKKNILSWIRPDGKAQVTFKYEDGIAEEIVTVVVSTQHDSYVTHEQIEKDIKEHVIFPVCAKYINSNTKFFIPVRPERRSFGRSRTGFMV